MNNLKKMNIVCFDGVCSICDGFVNFLIQRDTNRVLRYTSLQNKLIHPFLLSNQIDPHKLEYIVFIKKGKIYKQSDAVFEIFSTIKYLAPLVKFLRICPRPLRDIFYNLVATNRYRIKKPLQSCRIPTPEEKDLFL